MGEINEFAAEGKKIITYNHQIFMQELENLQNSIFQIHGILSHSYKLRKLVINVMGDIITNDRIFPEQVFEIDKCVGLQIWDAIPIWAKFFNNLLKIYDKIEVVCCVGNHGRSNPNHYNGPVENNFEYFIYRTWQEQFKSSKRIKVIVPNTRRYVYNIGPWRHLIEHGDQLKGFSDTAIEKQLKDIAFNSGNFDVMHFGHIHKLKEREISDKVLVKQNGCFGKDTPILMGDFTYKNIQDIKIGDTVIGFNEAYRGFDLVKTKVTNTFIRQSKVGELIFSDDRKLIVTTDHPIYTINKKSITSKGWVWKFPYQSFKTYPLDLPKINLRESLPWKLGYIKGFLDGDGNIFRKDNRIVLHFYNNEYDLIVWLKNTINELLKVEAKVGMNAISKDENTFSIQLGKKYLVEQLLNMFVKWENHEYFARGYLAGFFDAEGNYRCGTDKSNCLRVFNTHEDRLERVYKYCKQLGFTYSTKTRKSTNIKHRDVTTVLISPFFKFFMVCQPFLNRKKNMVKCNPTIGKNYHSYDLIAQKSFNIIGEETVYNFETESHTYIANGIPVHNCWVYKEMYGWEKFKSFSIPKQHFFGCNEKRPETWGYKIDLRG